VESQSGFSGLQQIAGHTLSLIAATSSALSSSKRSMSQSFASFVGDIMRKGKGRTGAWSPTRIEFSSLNYR
jgi:hypothetical protein